MTKLEIRFWRKVTKTSGCWEWSASRNAHGYGQIAAPRPLKRPLLAHRVSWEIHNGPIPIGLLVLHRCDNPHCVRPDHLFVGDQKLNMQDMVSKKRENPCGRGVTRCKRGHEFTPSNTYLNRGRRTCRTCMRLRARIKYSEMRGRVSSEAHSY